MAAAHQLCKILIINAEINESAFSFSRKYRKTNATRELPGGKKTFAVIN